MLHWATPGKNLMKRRYHERFIQSGAFALHGVVYIPSNAGTPLVSSISCAAGKAESDIIGGSPFRRR